MTAHTPGPWYVADDDRCSLTHIDVCHSDDRPGAASSVIAKVTCRVSWLEEQRDNARLIAAAPDLLAVLMQIQRMGYSDFGDRLMVDAAIAKATGGAA